MNPPIDTHTIPPTLDDAEFQRRFLNCTLAPEYFDHRGHLRLAWLVLTQQPLEQAIVIITQGIQAYATHLGAKDKFHHTLTEAIVRLMWQRIQTQPQSDFSTFLAHNRDLRERMNQVLTYYYTPQCLHSAEARRSFVPPDRHPLEQASPTMMSLTNTSNP